MIIYTAAQTVHSIMTIISIIARLSYVVEKFKIPKVIVGDFYYSNIV